MFDRALLLLLGYKKYLFINIALACSIALLDIIQSLSLTLSIVDAWTGDLGSSTIFLIVSFVVCYALRSIVQGFQESLSLNYSIRVSQDLEKRYASYLLYHCSSLDAEGISSSAISAVNGIDEAMTYVKMTLVKMSRLISITFLLTIFILVLDPISGVILLVLFPFIIVFMRLIGHTAHDETAKKKIAFDRMSNHFIDAVRGLPTLNAFGKDEGYEKNVEIASDNHRKLVMRTLRIATLSSSILDLFSVCSLAAIAIMLGFRIVEGDVSLTTGLLILLLTPEAFLPIRSFAADYHATLDGKNSLAAIFVRLEGTRIALGNESIPADPQGDSSKCKTAAPISIELKEVCSSYGATSIFENANAVFSGPGLCLVMGKSGSGKSTLLDLVSGFVKQDSGTIAFDGIDIDRLHKDNTRKSIAYIPQRPYIFKGTIRENILLYRRFATEEELDNVILIVGLREFINELPDGIETMIGDGERSLSGGQAHRIALARALIDPGRSVWIMDEPTAHLDVFTEYDLKKRIMEFAKDHLIIFATHRLHWLDSASCAYKIEDKKLISIEPSDMVFDK